LERDKQRIDERTLKEWVINGNEGEWIRARQSKVERAQ